MWDVCSVPHTLYFSSGGDTSRQNTRNLRLKIYECLPDWRRERGGAVFSHIRWLMRAHLVWLLLYSRSVVSNSLQPHGLQHTRLPCTSLSPGICSNSCPLSWWCHPTISSSATCFSFCLQSFPASESSKESAPRIRWPKYWSFSISPSSEYSGFL